MSENASNLRNEDFRNLLLTSVRKSGEAADALTPAPTQNKESSANFRHRQPKPVKSNRKSGSGQVNKVKKEKTEEDEDEANLKEILKNYRDRAAERRKHGDEREEDSMKLTAAYRAVPGDARAVADKADLRKQAILESKYLGGDMEHTHLVKGLDYSLLNKVRSEITKPTNDEDEDLENAFEEGGSNAAAVANNEMAQSNSDNRMVRAMHRILFKNELPLRNEQFSKGRMAFVVDLEDEEADIPTTLIRSLHDCPRAESLTAINANNLLISKLTQVLAYLRTDTKKKRRGGDGESFKRTEDVQKDGDKNGAKSKGDSIFDDVGDYVPKRHRDRSRDRDDRRDKERDRHSRHDHRDRDRERDREREKDRDRDGRKEYFGDRRRDDRKDERRDRRDQDGGKDRKEREKEREKEAKSRKEKEEKEREKKLEEKMEKRRKEAESSGYDECYPGGMVEMAGGWDSDEEDFSKMDLGSKKAPVNRWDFDNEEEYSKYQDSREAMPKAAYQYGVKTGDGRKTRKSQVSENKKLDRELDQINKIMEKRKGDGGGDGGEYKKPKY